MNPTSYFSKIYFDCPKTKIVHIFPIINPNGMIKAFHVKKNTIYEKQNFNIIS